MFVSVCQVSNLHKPGAFVPFSIFLLMRVMTRVAFNGVWWVFWGWNFHSLECLYKSCFRWEIFHQTLHKHLFVVSVFLSMSDNSPCSPLSLNSSSNGSGSNMQDSVFSTHNSAQSSNPSMLDGFGHQNSDQRYEPLRSTFSDALKFGVGGHGSCVKPTAKLKSGF